MDKEYRNNLIDFTNDSLKNVTLDTIDDTKFCIDLGVSDFKIHKKVPNHIANTIVYDNMAYIFQNNTVIKLQQGNFKFEFTLLTNGEGIIKDYVLSMKMKDKTDNILVQLIIDCKYDDKLIKIFNTTVNNFRKHKGMMLYSPKVYSALFTMMESLVQLIRNDETALRLNIIRERIYVTNNAVNNNVTKYPTCKTTIDISGVKIKYEYMDLPQKTYNRYCEGWHVRGHIRCYKDGRSVYIKPYYKGNKRDTNNKDYIVS